MSTIESAFVALRVFEMNPALAVLVGGSDCVAPEFPELNNLLGHVVRLFETRANSIAELALHRTSLLRTTGRGTDGPVIDVVVSLTPEQPNGLTDIDGFHSELFDAVELTSHESIRDLAAITGTPAFTNGKLPFEEFIEWWIAKINRQSRSRSVRQPGSGLKEQLRKSISAASERGISLSVVRLPEPSGA